MFLFNKVLTTLDKHVLGDQVIIVFANFELRTL